MDKARSADAANFLLKVRSSLGEDGGIRKIPHN